MYMEVVGECNAQFIKIPENTTWNTVRKLLKYSLISMKGFVCVNIYKTSLIRGKAETETLDWKIPEIQVNI